MQSIKTLKATQNIQEMEKKLDPFAPPHFWDAWVLPDQLILFSSLGLTPIFLKEAEMTGFLSAQIPSSPSSPVSLARPCQATGARTTLDKEPQGMWGTSCAQLCARHRLRQGVGDMSHRATRGLFPVGSSGQRWMLVKSWGPEPKRSTAMKPCHQWNLRGLANSWVLYGLLVLICQPCALSNCVSWKLWCPGWPEC